MSNDQFNFESLVAYQKAMDYVDFACGITKSFPAFEQFRLTDQFCRAGTSVPLNIGEGSAGTNKEFVSFLRISTRSINECLVCTTIAYRQKYISREMAQKSRAQLAELARLNGGLKRSIQEKIKRDKK